MERDWIMIPYEQRTREEKRKTWFKLLLWTSILIITTVYLALAASPLYGWDWPLKLFE